MLDSVTEKNGRALMIFCFKYPYYVVKIIVSCMTLYGLVGGNTKRSYKVRDGQYIVNIFTYRHTFVFQFWYCHQVNEPKNSCHTTISQERKWSNNFCTDRNFSWYLAMMEVNTALASGHFKNSGNIIPTFVFGRQLALQCMVNNIITDPGDIGMPIRVCTRTKIV